MAMEAEVDKLLDHAAEEYSKACLEMEEAAKSLRIARQHADRMFQAICKLRVVNAQAWTRQLQQVEG